MRAGTSVRSKNPHRTNSAFGDVLFFIDASDALGDISFVAGEPADEVQFNQGDGNREEQEEGEEESTLYSTGLQY